MSKILQGHDGFLVKMPGIPLMDVDGSEKHGRTSPISGQFLMVH